MSDVETTRLAGRRPRVRGIAAAGGLFAALGASACCILPLAFVLLGISGAWLGTLRAFEPYQPYFLGVGTLFVAAGFWRVYGRRGRVCETGEACARPLPGRLVKSTLWVSALLLLLSATVSFWAPLFY